MVSLPSCARAAFIGKLNAAALSLHKIEQDKFAAARLFGKLANICPDLPTAHLSSTSMFQAFCGPVASRQQNDLRTTGE